MTGARTSHTGGFAAKKPARRKVAGAVLAAAGLAALSGCVAPVGPVEVSRFHLPDTSALAHGSIAVVPAPGMDPASLELRSYQTAVATELARLGYTDADAGKAGQIAEVRMMRDADALPTSRSAVQVGGAAATGSYGSGVGLGLSFNLGGGAHPQVRTGLGVVIRDRASAKVLWEGRAAITVAATSPLANTQLAAPKLASALFSGFPGNSGETVTVNP